MAIDWGKSNFKNGFVKTKRNQNPSGLKMVGYPKKANATLKTVETRATKLEPLTQK